MFKKLCLAVIAFLFTISLSAREPETPYIIVLGTAQDGGYPHLGCEKECCRLAWSNPELKRFVVALALVDPGSGSWYLFEATPDMSEQIHYFRELTNAKYNYLPDAIFVSHAHIGHYTGLMELGREAMNSRNVPVYALPGMSNFLRNNGPWDQLLKLQNIDIIDLSPESGIAIADNISVQAFEVANRDEYSETAGYRIAAGTKKYLFSPDINKWKVWTGDIISEVRSVDYAFIDGTFYSENELAGRSMEEIPHPFITETIHLFGDESNETKRKINFIHLNHSNPALYDQKIIKKINESGFGLAEQGRKYW